MSTFFFIKQKERIKENTTTKNIPKIFQSNRKIWQRLPHEKLPSQVGWAVRPEMRNSTDDFCNVFFLASARCTCHKKVAKLPNHVAVLLRHGTNTFWETNRNNISQRAGQTGDQQRSRFRHQSVHFLNLF